MKLSETPPVHLTYCLNVHPGQTWSENFSAIREQTLKVRDRVGRTGPFGLGLRLSAEAADELSRKDKLEDFAAFLRKENLYVFTINGFPYGQFHGTRVKEDVYSPDWRTSPRAKYTLTLAGILAELLPPGIEGSISTVPLSYRPWIKSQDDIRRMARQLANVAAELYSLAQASSRRVAVALEPEPDCYLETTRQTVDFLTGAIWQEAVDAAMKDRGLASSLASDVRKHVGVCLDTAHAAVEFEDLAGAIRMLQAARVPIPKIQLSAALLCRPAAAAIQRLRKFCDPVYLHQVKARREDGAIASYPDLADVLDNADAARATEWRIHFHVPLFWGGDETLSSSRSLFTEEFRNLLRAGASHHLEIETYTFSVMPDFMRAPDLSEAIAREYQFVLEMLAPQP